ncbi:zf-HC2 domain-containing protein [Nocardia sp. NPDC050710]|uniref:zf-HC2 domain-containing protein n=1 Tax=Nocardia sp. NPDC050710 TaxID=3157220 RepID=UPI0033C95170
MECALAREALSARLDGEQEPVPAADLDAHLAQCASCQSWFAAAGELARRTRVQAAPTIPDLTTQILAASATPERGRARGLNRVLLAATGVAQLAVAVAQAAGIDFGMTAAHGEHAAAMSAHLLNESTAWTAALGVGFLVATLRPRAAAALAPVAGVFVVVLGCYVLADWVADRVTPARLASHSLVVLGAVLLSWMAWDERGGGRQRGPVAGTEAPGSDESPGTVDPAVSARESAA